jgi:hypothetical protein
MTTIRDPITIEAHVGTLHVANKGTFLRLVASDRAALTMLYLRKSDVEKLIEALTALCPAPDQAKGCV